MIHLSPSHVTIATTFTRLFTRHEELCVNGATYLYCGATKNRVIRNLNTMLLKTET